MGDFRNHTRQVIERAQIEPVTITDGGTPIAVLIAPAHRTRVDGMSLRVWIRSPAPTGTL